MAVFTCITEVRGSFQLTQHAAIGPEAALRAHIAAMPYDDGDGPFDDELDWLLRVSDGVEPIELLAISNCQGTWMWLAGSQHEPPYSTHIVRTDVG